MGEVIDLIPKGYKGTDIGVFPEEWGLASLVEVSTVTMGQSPSSKSYNTSGIGLPLIQGNADIENRRTKIRSFTSDITKRGKSGDIIMTVRAPVGEIAKTSFDCCLGRGVCGIRPNSDNDFLFFYLVFIEPQWKRKSTGSTFDSINSKEVKNTIVPLPTSFEQINIGTALSDIDTLIENLEKLIVKKKALKEGVMQDLLTGKKRLPGFSGEWEERLLGDIFVLSASSSKSKFINESGNRLIMDMGSVSSGGQNIATKRTSVVTDLLHFGDLVMPKDDIGGGNIIGKVAFIDQQDKYILGDHVYKLTLKASNADPLFYSYLINSRAVSNALRKKVSGSAQLGLGKKSVQEQGLRAPIDKEEQVAIASILSEMSRGIRSLERSLAKYQQIKAGMMQQLLTGKIRLI